MAERSNEKVNWHRSHAMVDEYECSHFSARRAASLFVASVAKPPVEDMTSGVKDECSISLTLCSYILFFIVHVSGRCWLGSIVCWSLCED